MIKSLLALTTCLPLYAPAQSGTIDLTDLANYANQPLPNYINRDNTPNNNAITDLGATLGRILFYDKRLSKNNTISCASCHQQGNGFSDLAIASTGVAGTTGRHSMRLVNSRFAQSNSFFWDERAATLEVQTSQPIQDHIEMGFSGTLDDPDFSDLVDKLSAIDEYRVLFNGVYGNPNITEDRVQKPLAQFVRSIQSFDSKYDDGRATVLNDGAPFPNFTASENSGKALFLAPPGGPGGGGAGCAACHQPPTFDIDPNSGNNGVVTSLEGGTDFTNTRSPSLRDLTNLNGTPNGPFMHDGSKATLAAVVAHYNAIPAIVPGLDPRLIRGGGPGGGTPQNLNLSTQEQTDLVNFLETLSGNDLYTDPKWSPPFDENDQLTLIVIPDESMAMAMSSNASQHTSTLSAQGVPGFDYLFQQSTDGENWSDTPITADINGNLSIEVTSPTSEQKKFYRFAYPVPQ
ncbi:MAG: cytochrome-c peroxidase [Roseibacillus sp.]